jgi:hypothetical protein
MTLMIATFLSSIYLMVIQAVNGVHIESIVDLRFVQNNLVNILILNVAIIVDKLQKRGYTKKKSIELLLWLGSFQGLFSIAGLFIPSIRAISHSLYQASGGDNVFVMESRIFGLSGEFTYGTPIYHGILAGVAFYFLIRDRVNYVVPILLIVTAAGMNGRTGLVVFVAMMAHTLFITYGRRGNVLGIAALLSAALIAYFTAMTILSRISPPTHRFIQNFVLDTQNFIIHGETTGNYGVLVEEIGHAPEGIAFVFGTGEHFYDGADSFRSDIGFTNDLFAGGLLYIFVLYLIFFAFILRNSGGRLLLSVELVVVFCLANLKGEVLRSSIILFIFLFMTLLYNRSENCLHSSPEQLDSNHRHKFGRCQNGPSHASKALSL